MPGRFPDDQRLAFGRVAELYHRARPSYPRGAVDDVIEFGSLAPGSTVLEVGAGTGKATLQFADRGLRVLALEPSRDMVRVARAACAAHPGVEIVEVEFERWRPTEPVAAVLSAQAWHWIDPDDRYEKAHEALVPGGTLAAIWTFPEWQRCSLRGALSDAYGATVPELAAAFPMHPDSRADRLAGNWHCEIDGGSWFTKPTVRRHRWRQSYTSTEYVQLIQTHQDHILLDAGRRERLLAAIRDAIDAAGATLTMPFVTHVCLAVRA